MNNLGLLGENKRRKRFPCAAALITGTLLLSGCLSPADTGRPSLSVKESVYQNYEMTTVKSGAIEKTKIVVATYQQVKKNELKFSVNGKRLKALYVKMGDTVKQGTLLAELRMDEEEVAFEKLSLSMSEKKLQKKHLEEQKALEEQQLLRKKSRISADDYHNEQKRIEEKYRITLEDLSDELTIMEMQYEKLETELSGGKLYAGMDGIITKITQMNYGFVSTAGTSVITVSDSTVCAFECSSPELIPYFTVGDTYLFRSGSGDKTYETVCAEADEEKEALRFELKTPDDSLPIGLRVLHTLVTDRKENILYLPKKAVHTADGNAYVYFIDENGIRRMKDITIGLRADNEVEICSGISEGEEVILQ